MNSFRLSGKKDNEALRQIALSGGVLDIGWVFVTYMCS